MKKLLLLCLLLVTLPGQASDKLIQLIEYIGADYKEAVQQGQVVNAAEFAEMQEFASLIPAQLPPEQHELQQQAVLLQQLVAAHADEADIQQLTAAMRKAVIAAMPAIALPQQAPDRTRGQALYQQNCAACHGEGMNKPVVAEYPKLAGQHAAWPAHQGIPGIGPHCRR